MAASQRLGVRSWWSQFSSSATRIKSAPPLFGNGTTHSKRLGGISSDGGLSRKLGLADLILLGIGASIGAGIFVVTGTVAHDAGPAVVVSFALAATACVPNALSYAELSSRFPALVGGAYMYSYSTFNELTAFLVFCHLMLDYHIGAASITRSLASYLVTSLQIFPIVKALPPWVGPGGLELFGGALSINVIAPLLLVGLTIILCQGVKESSVVNDVMTIAKVSIVLMVIAVGSFEVDTSNWTPFTPNGLTPVITGATVVFFAYVGFDAVANSAEECKNPQRDLPIGILVSLFVCAGLYVAVCFVVTGMVPYINLGGDAPLANAFMDKGLNFVSILISVGAVCGLTTTVLVGLYVQSRLYLGLGRDGLLPAFFAKIDAHHQTPVTAQVWVGSVAAILAGFFNVSHLSHILSVGCLASYSIVCACVVMLRINTENQWQDGEDQLPQKGLTRWNEAVLCMLGISLCGFLVGLCYRTGGPVTYEIVLLVIMGLLLIPLLTRQVCISHYLCCFVTIQMISISYSEEVC
uniref:Cationic amino acid transporter C-terminal domain-containing protein n=1 Tax=Physcomitrium patens TaxID=3218 RepID=A0A7I4AQR7_PHYPA